MILVIEFLANIKCFSFIWFLDVNVFFRIYFDFWLAFHNLFIKIMLIRSLKFEIEMEYFKHHHLFCLILLTHPVEGIIKEMYNNGI